MTTRITKSLLEMGLAENTPCGNEYCIFLTPEGVRMKDLVSKYVEECIGYLFAEFSEEDIAAIDHYYNVVCKRIDAYRENH